jgi:hypothetical protein
MNKKELQLVSFGQAARLQDFGFDWQTTYSYFFRETGWVVEKGYKIRSKIVLKNGWEREYVSIPVPTVALALKWMRDEQDIICHVITQMKHFVLKYKYLYRTNYRQKISEQSFNNYEAAESALLDELLTILEKEKK